MKRFHSVLVANRGEIALRVLRTVRAQGLRGIAVYSTADADAPHVRLADTALCIGPPPSSQSYLAIERILEAARQSGAEAIHPGYGFLSENAAFARAVAEAGLIFIGPPAAAIETMGDKAVSKRAMLAAGVPCIPGYQGEDQSTDRLRSEAERIGFPLMVKAAAGGGGRGMRLVSDPDGLMAALQQARAEAESAFGSSDLILEKALLDARHVEIQVFADEWGNVVHLGERDCSVQRRHQKVLEESPCPVMTPELRALMGSAAVEAARAVDYRGAGTVEFLLDGSGNFYFLEMNTRLQVEHPVTELVTGLDLVALQLSVAQGQPLPFGQEDVKLRGHAIEARLYAEDPDNDFLPSTGEVVLWQPPEREGVRCDAGIDTGLTLSPFYDPMVAKIIAHGTDRAQALTRLQQALEQTTLLGVQNNRRFLLAALAHPVFARGEATTAFVGTAFAGLMSAYQPDDRALAAAVAIRHELLSRQARDLATGIPDELMGWSSAGLLESPCALPDGTLARLWVLGQGRYRVERDGSELSVSVRRIESTAADLSIEGHRLQCRFARDANGVLHIGLPDGGQFSLYDVATGVVGANATRGGADVLAPMHGLLVSLAVSAGDAVMEGDLLAVVEAMKMQLNVVAERAGVVERIAAEVGAQLAADDLILSLRPADAGP